MTRYLILKIMNYNGLRFPGELIELTDAEAKMYPVRPYEPEQPPVETADLHINNPETADIEPVRKGRVHENTSRKHKK